MPRPRNQRPTIHVKPTINEPSPYSITAEFSWVWEGQLYGGLFSLTGIPDQNKLVAEIHNIDPGVEVRNETTLLEKVRQRKPGSFSGRAAHIIQLARIRDSGLTNMHDAVAVHRLAYQHGYDALVEWFANNWRVGYGIKDKDAWIEALNDSAFVGFDAQGNAIERV